jgi:hypothetical protein
MGGLSKNIAFLFYFLLLISCNYDKNYISNENNEQEFLPKKDSTSISNKYFITYYGNGMDFEENKNKIQPFSQINLNEPNTGCFYCPRSRMIFLENAFKWDISNELDSVFVFGVSDSSINSKGINIKGIINFEVWHKVQKQNLIKISDSLNNLFDGRAIYYKPPSEWHWFIYKEKFFFMDCSNLGWREELYPLKDKYMKDTLFLEYILNQL